jgi:phosphate ABC transporter phosphate-binding protein
MISYRLYDISLNSECLSHADTMMNMSNQPAKGKTSRYVIVAVLIIAIIAGGAYYQFAIAQSAATTSSEAQTNSSESQMTTPTTSETMSSTMAISSATQPAVTVSLLGAGATFPAPLIQQWTVEYNKLNPSVTINYNPIGSGGGIQQITAKTVDFGASDAPLNDKQLAAAPGLVLFPETLGGVAVTYNLAPFGVSNTTTLNFNGFVLASIYYGNITKWNDPAIQQLNPGVNLPPNQITAVHRSDGSGTTYAFTNFLSAVNHAWGVNVGYSTSVTWPVDKVANGVGAKGNAGVAGTVKNTAGAIGYVDVIYAEQQHLGVGAVLNAAGNYILPTLQAILYAAQNATGTPNPSDLRLHIVNAAGPQSYPIATYTYLLVYKDMSLNPDLNIDKAKALAQFFWWAVHDGQQYSQALIYVPLPQNVVSADEQLLNSLNFQGQPLLSS